MTTIQKWQFVAEIAQAAGAILAVLLAAWTAGKVHQYTKRKDRLDFLSHKYSIQQDINMIRLENADLAVDFERLVYGESIDVDPARARRTYTLFLILNMVLSDWFACKEHMITDDEFREFAARKLRMVARHRKTLEYLVEYRGYPRDFAEEIKGVLQHVEPLPPPDRDALG